MRANEPNAHLIDGRQNFKIDVWPFSFVLGLNRSPRQKMRLTSYQVKITFGNSICSYLLIDKGDVVIQTLCRSQKVEALRLLNLKIYSRYLTHSVDTAHFYYIFARFGMFWLSCPHQSELKHIHVIFRHTEKSWFHPKIRTNINVTLFFSIKIELFYERFSVHFWLMSHRFAMAASA